MLLEHVTAQPRNPAAELSSDRVRRSSRGPVTGTLARPGSGPERSAEFLDAFDRRTFLLVIAVLLIQAGFVLSYHAMAAGSFAAPARTPGQRRPLCGGALILILGQIRQWGHVQGLPNALLRADGLADRSRRRCEE
jgi:hypothetical protein